MPAIRWAAASLCVVALAALSVPPATADETVRTAFRVKYVAQGSVYLDGGRSVGLTEGMKLNVRRTEPVMTGSGTGDAEGKWVIARLEVVSVAETSAVCEVQSQGREIKPGDTAYLAQEEVEAIVRQRALSPTRKYPQVITFTEGDPLDEEIRAAVPRPPSPEVNRARGRIGFEYSAVRGSSGTSSQVGLVLRTDISRISGTYWNMSGYWRGRLASRSAGQQETVQDLINRTYHISMTYDNPNSSWVAGFGRLYLPWANSLDTIDGGYFGRRWSKQTTAGVFAGSTPDPTSWSYDPNRRIGGLFVNFEGGSFDDVRYTSTSGVAVSTSGWRIDRPFVFFENGIFFKHNVSIYHSLQADSPRTQAGVTPVGAGISRSYLTLRVQASPKVSFDVSHNYFRDLPTFDPRLVGTGLLDKYLFQGLSGGVRIELPKRVTVYSTVGRSSSNRDEKSSWNQMFGVTVGQIWKTGVRADLRYSQFDSAFAQGSYKSLALSRNFGEDLRLELQAGTQTYTSTFTTDTGTRFMSANVDYSVSSRYFIQAGFSAQRGGFQDYDQWFAMLGYRFDSRGLK